MFFILIACLMFLFGAFINIQYAETSYVEDVFILFLGTIIMILFGIYCEVRQS